jgi:alpha-tubulin suppressor-like RCC1 family protein
MIASVLLVAAAIDVRAQTIAGGAGHTVILKPDGTVWSFGNNKGNSATTH